MILDKPFLRFQARRFYRYLMRYSMDELEKTNLERSAIIFSPHPDDETLGCGGTIIKKRRAGAEVKIVFMTAGRKSHRHLISETSLKAIRSQEALAASRTLGIDERDVIFLKFEDGELSRNQNSATHEVIEILMHYQPEEIFIPSSKEPYWPKDHLVTNRIVTSALRMRNKRAEIYEYPIWFWYHWPWASIPLHSRSEFLTFLKNTVISHSSLLREFRCSVYIGDILELKRAVLEQYKSQMTRLIPDPRWGTLTDLSNGEFLECFFQEYEFFHHYDFHE